MVSLPVKIAGVGKYLPAQIVTSTQLEQQLGIPAGWVERMTGVRERRYAGGGSGGGETVTDMAAAAAREALAMAGLTPADLDAIIGASASVRQAIPCSAVYVQRALGAPDGKSACFDMNATCLSFVFALQHAAHLVAAGVYKNVLIVSSERGTHSRSPTKWESAVLFGDGAAAAVVSAAQAGEPSAIWHSHFVTYSSGAELTQLLGAGTLHHPNDPATSPEMNTFDMRGPELLVLAARVLPAFVDEFCRQLGWNRQAFDAVVPHQASLQGLRLLRRCGIAEAKVVDHLLERGNCIAASIPLALAEAVEGGRIRRGDKVLLIGTSAGISLGALALTF